VPVCSSCRRRARRRRKHATGQQGKLWEHAARQPIAGFQQLHVPRRTKRPARVATMAISYARVALKAPHSKGHFKPVTLWAVWAREIDAPAGSEPLEWRLLTTCEVASFEQATEKLAWYTARWGIEVYHRTLKSGCQIETRQLGSADRIEACLAIDLVVAWRILPLTTLGREHPDVPCTVYFSDREWKMLVTSIWDATLAGHSRTPRQDGSRSDRPGILHNDRRLVESVARGNRAV
jgi:hypothetical protein